MEYCHSHPEQRQSPGEVKSHCLKKQSGKLKDIKELGVMRQKYREKQKGRQPPGVEPRTPDWWLSGCRSSVAEHCRLKPGVLGLTPSDYRRFSLSCIFTSKHLNSFISSLRQDTLSNSKTLIECSYFYLEAWLAGFIMNHALQ